MTISSVLSNQGFTPLPTYINPGNGGRRSGRGLSIQQPRQHQREIARRLNSGDAWLWPEPVQMEMFA